MRYFTFFFCGTKWRQPQAGPRFIRWLIDVLPLRSPLSIAGGQTIDSRSPDSFIKGDYQNYRDSLDTLPVARFVIMDRSLGRQGLEIGVCCELAHLAVRYDRAKSENIFHDPQVVLEEVPEGIKTLSVSIREDIWEAYKKSARKEQTLRKSEEVFVLLGCLYGYGDCTTVPVTAGAFGLIGSQPGCPRVLDFHYSKHIERVYRYNFISATQMTGTGVRSALLSVGDGIESKQLFDVTGQEIGVAVYLHEYSERTIRLVQHCLEPLLWEHRLKGG